MSGSPVFTSQKLREVVPLSVSTDFDVYENDYFATDVDTMLTNISNEVNKLLRQGYGLLNDDFSVQPATTPVSGLHVKLKFYHPLHFETFCKIGQERSIFLEAYLNLCRVYLTNTFSYQRFIDTLKKIEKDKNELKKLYTQELVLFTSSKEYDESIPPHVYERNHGSDPFIEMYKKAKEEALSQCDKNEHLLEYSLFNPILPGPIYRSSPNHFIVFVCMYKLHALSVDEALSIYSFDKPEYVQKSDSFYKHFSKLSLLYLMSELSEDEFYTKLVALEKE